MSEAAPTVILLGASVRALATSALRAGWTPWCADLFADADLERIATVRKVPFERYPYGLLEALKDAPPGPVIYTGGLENWSSLIAKIDRPLWGNAPDVLRFVRSPERWTQHLRANRRRCPRIAIDAQDEGSWLLKPRKSGGGIGIHAYAGQPFNCRTHFLQERVDGKSRSAVLLGTKDWGTFVLGVTQQLVGIPWLNSSGFQYCGNIGPLPWKSSSSLWTSFSLKGRGLLGVDAMVHQGYPCPVEFNPRYTASVEILERSYGCALLPAHREAFERDWAWSQYTRFLAPVRASKPKQIWGKAILYARRTFAFPADGPWLDALADGVDLNRTEYADIPHPGDEIEQGRPVLTLFASAKTVSKCEAMLQEKAAALDRILWG